MIAQGLAEGDTAIFVTFLLAIIGYVGLTAVVLLSLKGKVPFVLWRAIAGVIVAHVLMVWHFRYEWQFSQAVRNGYAGFAIFSTAVLLVVWSALFSDERRARLLIQSVFVIVSAGALGASFRYEVVAIYRVPVILCAAAGGGSLLWHLIKKRRTSPRK